ncbi:membrane hypothetical protein [Rhodospirillaceae bacterium LM-1]|nr:membrane hypothetical protein [Rhodospirillaceae bacterium LM-1]
MGLFLIRYGETPDSKNSEGLLSTFGLATALFCLLSACTSFMPRDDTPEAKAQFENDRRECFDQSNRKIPADKNPIGLMFVGAFLGATEGATTGAYHGEAGEWAWIGAAAGAGAGFLAGLGANIYESDKTYRLCMEGRSYVAAKLRMNENLP